MLYLDPQSGHVGNLPLYPHSGVPGQQNVIGIDALVLGRDGRPMALAGRPVGDYSVLPDPPERPEPPPPPAPPPHVSAEDLPDFNHVHLLGESTTFATPGAVPPPVSSPDPDPGELRQARLDAHANRISAGVFVRDALAARSSLDEVFAAGVTPVELAIHLDAPKLRQLVPGLDEAAARDVTRLLADPRVQQMLDHSWEAPPRGEPLLAETLVRQLTQRPDLVRMILATPELANSLTARPMTLHHLASHQQAIDVLGEVLDDIAERGAAVVAAEGTRLPASTPLSNQQRRITEAIQPAERRVRQPEFDLSRKDDESYRRDYLMWLYAEAAVAQQELTELVVRMAADTGRPGWRIEPKDHQRVLDKLVEYDNDASLVKDLAAAKIQFDRLDDLYEALRLIGADSELEVLDKKDRFVHPQRSGYRDVLLRLRMTNGHVGELRLQLAPLDAIAEWEHALYEIRRDLEALAELKERPLTVKELAIRDALLHREQQAFWNALGDQAERKQVR